MPENQAIVLRIMRTCVKLKIFNYGNLVEADVSVQTVNSYAKKWRDYENSTN
jgi:hypothetical protein